MSFFVADVGVKLDFTVTDRDGAVVNLTGSTVELIVDDVEASPFSCTISSPTEGRCFYTVQAGNFPAGIHKAQLRVTQASNIFHSDVFDVKVLNVVISG